MRAEALKSLRNKTLRRLFRALEHGFAVVGVLFVVYYAAFDLAVVTSPSMSPTLKGEGREGSDRVLTEKVSYWFRGPRRWEVVTFLNKEGEQRMKRAVGLPGETVSFARDELVVNGARVARPESLASLQYYPYGNLHGGATVPCRDGYYVLGDDSRDYDDSRYNGPVGQDAIIGRAWLVVWPPARLGFVSP